MDKKKSKNADAKTESQLIAERIHFLHENTDFALTLFQNLVGYAIIAADFDGNIIAFNRGAELIYGCTAEEIVGKERFDGLLPCNFIESWETRGTAELLNKERYSCEIEMSRKNGEVFPAHLLFTLTKDSGGKTIGFVLIVHDLTERMLAEQAKALQQIVVSYKTLVESSPDVLMLLDANMIIILCSSLPGIELFGFADNPKAIIGRNFFDFVDPRQQQHLKDEIANIKKVGVIRSAEYQFIRKDGTAFFGEIGISIFLNPKGNPESYIVVVRDVTQRKKVEQSYVRLVSIIEATSDFVSFADAKDTHLLYINKEGRKMCGIGEDDDITKLKIADVHPAWTNKLMDYEIIPTAIRDGIWEGECAFLNRDGREIPVSMVLISHKTSTGEVAAFSTISRDITERKRLEEERERLKEQLYHAQKIESVGTLAGGIAHDFNNILTAIIGYGSLLRTEIEENATAKDFVHRIMKSAERAANLTRSLLAFSRKQPTNPEPINLNAVVKDVESMLTRVIREDIKLKTILIDKNCIIMADCSQIEQVLTNLATNARDAMPKGGLLTISTGVIEIDNSFIKAHGYGVEGMYALISVSDTGIGMDEKTIKRIFEPFFTTKEVGKGTGLGLAIVYGIVKQHNGYINVYSEPGKGTTFRIYLPLIKSEIERAKAEIHTIPKGGTEMILLAEDDTDVRSFMKIALEGHGYKVIEAVDGGDAINKFREHKDKIQLLILDVIMPTKNGKETYDAIKTVKPDIKALFVSGYCKDIIKETYISEEGLNFISKPVSPIEILKKVREVLDR